MLTLPKRCDVRFKLGYEVQKFILKFTRQTAKKALIGAIKLMHSLQPVLECQISTFNNNVRVDNNSLRVAIFCDFSRARTLLNHSENCTE